MKKQKDNDKDSNSNRDFKLADGKSLSYVGKDGNSNVYSDIGKSFGSNSYPSGDSSRGGEGGKGGQWGYSGSNSGQTKINPQVAKQITDKISSSESAIQNEIGRLKGLNPIASEETLRSAAIQFLGIATVEELRELEAYKIDQSKNIPSELVPYFASHSGKVIGWLEHQNKTLNLNFNIAGKDLDMSNKQITDENMLFFCQKMTSFTFHFDNLIISNNLMTNLSVQYLFNATLTSPTNRTIKNLDLRNNQIGDVGAELIAAYLKHGYMPATTHVNLADNIITDKGALCFAESLNSSVNKLKVLHLEGNNLNFNSNPKIIKLVQNVKQDIKILVCRVSDIIDGVKKQGKLFYGSKEDKQDIVKNILKQAQDNGVDVKNVTVNKDIFNKVVNGYKLGLNFSYGYVKCNILPESAKEFVGDQIIATASKNANVVNKVIGTFTCYFETFDKSLSSQEGVQFINDIGLVGNVELNDSIE